MSEAKIGRIIDALRHERYRFTPAKRAYIPKKNGKKRPLGLPSWSDKLVGEVIRLLLEAYYEPQFSDRSHGFRTAGDVTPRCARWRLPGQGRPG
jgi:retron-type reverse transcriptase